MIQITKHQYNRPKIKDKVLKSSQTGHTKQTKTSVVQVNVIQFQSYLDRAVKDRGSTVDHLQIIHENKHSHPRRPLPHQTSLTS